MEHQKDEWVEVRSFNWLHEAQFIKSVLESAGIEAMIPDEHTLGVQPLYGALLGGARVFVQANDLTRAIELLETTDDTSGSERSDLRRHD